MMKRCWLLAITVLAATSTTRASGQGPGQGFDLTRLRPVMEDTKTPAGKRLSQGIAFLRQELTNPSPERWGVGGGPIDTGYIQQSMTGAIAFPGADAPSALRKLRDVETNAAMKDRLTVALAMTGFQDTIPSLIRIARKEPVGAIRYQAVIAVTTLVSKPRTTDVPKRAHAAQAAAPMDNRNRQAVVAVLTDGLNDSFKRYNGAKGDNSSVYFPIQEQSAKALRLLGYDVKRIKVGWRLADSQGRFFRFIAVKPSTPGRKP